MSHALIRLSDTCSHSDYMVVAIVTVSMCRRISQFNLLNILKFDSSEIKIWQLHLAAYYVIMNIWHACNHGALLSCYLKYLNKAVSLQIYKI